MNQSRRNPKRCSSNPQESKKRKTGMRTRDNAQKINNKMADLSDDTITLNVKSLHIPLNRAHSPWMGIR